MNILATFLVPGRQNMDQQAPALSPPKMHCNANTSYACTAAFALKLKPREQFAHLINPCENISRFLPSSTASTVCPQIILDTIMHDSIVIKHLKKTLLRDRDTWQAVDKSWQQSLACMIWEMSLVAPVAEENAVKPSVLNYTAAKRLVAISDRAGHLTTHIAVLHKAASFNAEDIRQYLQIENGSLVSVFMSYIFHIALH